jgi:hypothetical protein
VLWKLLDGSGYNVLMIGGRGTSAPLEIILSARSTSSPQAAGGNPNGSSRNGREAAGQREPEPPPTVPSEPRDPFNTSGQSRDPMDFMQEILQRQQKIDQQEQQRQDERNNPQR